MMVISFISCDARYTKDDAKIIKGTVLGVSKKIGWTDALLIRFKTDDGLEKMLSIRGDNTVAKLGTYEIKKGDIIEVKLVLSIFESKSRWNDEMYNNAFFKAYIKINGKRIYYDEKWDI